MDTLRANRIRKSHLSAGSLVVQVFSVVAGMLVMVQVSLVLGFLFMIGLFLYGLSLTSVDWACSHCRGRLEDNLTARCRNCGALLE